jgi:hypothetical protein
MPFYAPSGVTKQGFVLTGFYLATSQPFILDTLVSNTTSINFMLPTNTIEIPGSFKQGTYRLSVDLTGEYGTYPYINALNTVPPGETRVVNTISLYNFSGVPDFPAELSFPATIGVPTTFALEFAECGTGGVGVRLEFEGLF